MPNRVQVRKFQDKDARAMVDIFYNTIHQINKKDYAQAQLDVWAPKSKLELDGWLQKWQKLNPFVAVVDEQVVGFAEFENNGHIDCFYCHHDWVGKGVGSALMKAIDEQANASDIHRIYAEVSITARPFFEAKGFKVVKPQTVIRDGVELQNFVMEKYLKEDIYTEQNVPLFEAIYGTGLISLGGYEAVDDMLSGLALKGMHCLDVGSGIGGMAYHIAKNYDANVTGLELHHWMSHYCLKNAPEEIKDRLDFVSYDKDGQIPCMPGSFDLVYSKGVLTNIQDKKSLFKQLSQLLKSTGQLRLVDWLQPDSKGPKTEQLKMGDMSYKETRKTYQEILSACGFKDIDFEDKSSKYLDYVHQLGERLESTAHKEQYANVLDDELRQRLIDSNNHLKDMIETKQQFSVLISASK